MRSELMYSVKRWVLGIDLGGATTLYVAGHDGCNTKWTFTAKGVRLFKSAREAREYKRDRYLPRHVRVCQWMMPRGSEGMETYHE